MATTSIQNAHRRRLRAARVATVPLGMAA